MKSDKRRHSARCVCGISKHLDKCNEIKANISRCVEDQNNHKIRPVNNELVRKQTLSYFVEEY